MLYGTSIQFPDKKETSYQREVALECRDFYGPPRGRIELPTTQIFDCEEASGYVLRSYLRTDTFHKFRHQTFQPRRRKI